MSDAGRATRRALVASPGFLIAVACFALAGMASLAQLIAGVLPSEPPSDAAGIVDYVERALGAQLIGALVPVVLLACWPGPPRQLGRASLGIVGWYVVCLCLWLPIAFWLHPLLLRALDVTATVQPHLEYFVLEGARPGWFIALATVCLFGPIAEEIVFRGFLQTGLRGIVGRWPALILTSVLFGLLHGLQYALPLALLGGVFGFLRERYAGMLAPVLAHVLHNSLTVAAVIAAPELLRETYPR